MLNLVVSKALRRFVGAILVSALAFSLMLTAAAGDDGLSVVATRPVDIALAVGISEVDFSSFEKDLKAALSEYDGGNGQIDAKDINITGIESTEVSTSSSFEWLEFDHSNNAATVSGSPYIEATGTQSSNVFNDKDRHIVSTDSGTTLTFYGYGSSPYSDFMLLESHQRTQKEFTFAVKEYFAADALGGMGYFFNSELSYTGYSDIASAYADEKLYLNGYLMYLQYNGQSGQSITIFKVTGLNLHDFHAGVLTELAYLAYGASFESNLVHFEKIAQTQTGVYSGAHDLRKFRVVAQPSSVTVYYAGFDDDNHAVKQIYNEADADKFNTLTGDQTENAGYEAFLAADFGELSPVIFNNSADESGKVLLDTTHGGASFGPMTQYLDHNCGRLTKVEFSELSMKMDVVRSLTEVVRQPQWREGTDRFVVYINDTAIDDFASETATGELLNRLYEDNIYYVGWATDANVEASEGFLESAPGGKILNRSNMSYDDCIAATAKDIYDRYWKLYQQSTFVTGEGINIGAGEDSDYILAGSAGGDWPRGRWYVLYDDNDFYGMASYVHPQSGQFISSINDFDFSQPGQYTIYYECDLTDLGTPVQTILVHRPPVAAFADTTSGSAITLTSLAHDPDVIDAYASGQADGIVRYDWAVDGKAVGPEDHSADSITLTASAGVSYQVSLTVTDANGGTATTTRLVGLAATKDPIPYASFSIDKTTYYSNVSGHNTVNVTDKSYLLYGDGGALSYAYVLKDSDGKTVSSGTTKPVSFDAASLSGKYTLELTVSYSGVTSATVSRSFTVVTEPTPELTATGVFGLKDGDYIYAGTAVTLAQTAQDIISGITLQYSVDGGSWANLSGTRLTVPADSEGFAGATYTFKAVSGATSGNTSNTITLHVVPQDNPLSIEWGFKGDSFGPEDAFSTNNWYGNLEISAQGTAGYALVTSTALSGDGGSDTSKSGPASVSLAPAKGIASYSVSGEMVSNIRTSATGYATASDAITVRVDPTIDTFIGMATDALPDGGIQAIKGALSYYNNTLIGANRDHIGKNPVASALLKQLNQAVADNQAALVAQIKDLLDDGDTRAIYEEIQEYYDLLSTKTKAGLDGETKAALADKSAALTAADAAIDSLPAASQDKSGYEALAFAADSYNGLSPEALGLLSEGQREALGDLADLKVTIDGLSDAVAAIREAGLSPDSLNAISAAEAILDGLVTGKNTHYLPAGLEAQVKALADAAKVAGALQADIDALDSTAGLDDLRGPYGGYLTLNDDAKALVDTTVGDSDLLTLYEAARNAAMAAGSTDKVLEQLVDDIMHAIGNTGKTANDIKDLLARHDALPDGQKAAVPSNVQAALDSLKADYDAVKTVISGVTGSYKILFSKSYDELTPGQKVLVDTSTDGMGLVVSDAAKVKKSIEGIKGLPDPDAGDPDYREMVEQAMDAYVQLPDRGKALLDSALVRDLEKRYDEVLKFGDLTYINTGSTPAALTVTVVGMVDRVDLPPSAESEYGYSTTVALHVTDSEPDTPPQVTEGMTQVLSVDVYLWAQVLDDQLSVIEEMAVQPKAGESLTVLIQVPAQYVGKPLEVYHVKDNGLIAQIHDYSFGQIDGVHYLLIRMSSFSHIMVYADYVAPPTGEPDEIERKPLAVAITQSVGGTVSPNEASIPYGASRTFTVTPDDGYIIADVIVNGRSLGAVSTFTLEKVTGPVNIQVVFARAEGLPYYLEGEEQRFIGYVSPKSGQLRWIALPEVEVFFAPNPQSFDDIAGHYAEASVHFVAERQLMAGQDSLFAPGQGVSRAELVAMLGQLHERSFGLGDIREEHKFTDVDYTQPYGKYISWAEQNGIVLGISDSLYDPDRVITRQELAAILYRYGQYAGLEAEAGQELLYSDTDAIAAWAYDAALFCQQSGLIIGRPGSTFAPASASLRGDVAIVLNRLIDLAVSQLA